LTAEEYEQAQREMNRKRRTQTPERSAVEPVERGETDGFSDDITTLLAGLEPKITSEVIAKAGVLGHLPPAQQTLLRCALSAASESFHKAETIQDDLARVRKDLKQAETHLAAETEAFSRRSAAAEAQVASLVEDLAASVAAGDARETRLRKRGTYVGLALAAGLLVAIFVPRPAPTPGAAEPVQTQQSAPVSGEKPPDTSLPVVDVAPNRHADRDPPVGLAFNRLDRAFDRIPPADIESVARAANLWLIATRRPQCFLEIPEGEISLLIGPKRRDRTPLRTAFTRCAEAVDHVTQ
jgi:hypothetical protein